MPGLHPAPGVQWVLQREANYCKIGAFSPLVNSPRDWKTQIARQLMNNKFVDDWEQEHYNDFDLYSSSISKWVSNVNVTVLFLLNVLRKKYTFITIQLSTFYCFNYKNNETFSSWLIIAKPRWI